MLPIVYANTALLIERDSSAWLKWYSYLPLVVYLIGLVRCVFAAAQAAQILVMESKRPAAFTVHPFQTTWTIFTQSCWLLFVFHLLLLAAAATMLLPFAALLRIMNQ